MKRIVIFLTMLVAACTTPSYPSIDQPSTGSNTQKDRDIIAYIDERLETEYLPCCPFMAESVVVQLRGPFHEDPVQ